MVHLPTLSMIGLLSFAGIGLGVALGQSAAGEINPANLKDPQSSSSYAGLVPGGASRADWEQVQAQEYQAAVAVPPVAGCAGCTWPADPTPRHDPAVERTAQRTGARTERIGEPWMPVAYEPIRSAVADEGARDPDIDRVVRYANYRVERPDEQAGEQEAQDPDGPN